MSITPQEAEFEAGMDQLYNDFKQQYEDEYVFEKIQAYYKENPEIAKEPWEFCLKAELLVSDKHYTSGFLLATISIEVGLKLVILKPVLVSLATDKTAAELLYDSTFKHKSVPYIPKLYYQLLSDYTGFAFQDYILPASKVNLWDTLCDLQKLRNQIIHQATPAEERDVRQAIAIAKTIYEDVIPRILDRFQFHFEKGRIEYGSLKYIELSKRRTKASGLQ